MVKIKTLCVLLLITLAFCSCKQKAPKEYNATCIEDLTGSSTAVLMGTVADIYISETNPKANLLRLATPSDLLLAVESGQADYFMIDEASVCTIDFPKHNLKKSFIDNNSKCSGDAAFALRKNDVAFCDTVSQFIKMIKANGLLDSINSRWYTTEIDNVEMPDIPTPQGKPFVVGVCIGNMPFSFIKNGEWVGAEIEIFKRFAVYLNRPVEFVGYDFNALIISLNTNKIDIAASFMFITPERSKSVLFTEPYGSCGQVCVSRISDEKLQKKDSFWQRAEDLFQGTLVVENRWKMLLEGMWATFIISIGAILLGTLLAILVCALRMSKYKVPSRFAMVYIDLLRGIPMLVFLMIMFYVVFANSGISAIGVAIIAFALNFSAFESEVFRASISSIDIGQREAGCAMGFSRIKTFLYIIAPQAVRHASPIFKGDVTSLIKNTSIVGYIAIQDLTKVSDIIRSRTYEALFPLLIVTVVYFAMAWFMGWGIEKILLPKRVKKSSK